MAAHPRLMPPIRGDARLSAVERLDIYANMYFYRIRDSLMEDFPAVARVVGDAAFHNLATDYLLRHPSRHWSLRYAGERLPHFLRRHPLVRRCPFLPDLARFEWALITAYDASDATPLAREALLHRAPDTWGALRLRRIPACGIVPCRFPVDVVRERALGGTAVATVEHRSPNAATIAAGDPAPRRRAADRAVAAGIRRARTELVIWRRGFDVVYRRGSADECRWLDRLARPTRFATLCHRMAERHGMSRATRLAAGYLERWLADGLVCA